MLPLVAIVAATTAVAVGSHQGIACGWLLWLVALPALIGTAARRGARRALLMGLLGAVPMLWYDVVDALRFAAQIVGPGVLAGWTSRRAPLRTRDGWWLAVTAAGLSAAVGAAVGRADSLRDVVLPAGIPTGWVEVVRAQWGTFTAWWTVEPFAFARVEAFVDLVEPTLWFALLVPLMSAAVALVAPAAPAVPAAARRQRQIERDVALGVLVAGMAAALWGHGHVASIGANVAVIAVSVFLLEGMELIGAVFARLELRPLWAACGWGVIVTEPAAIMLLPALGLGDLWWGWKDRLTWNPTS